MRRTFIKGAALLALTAMGLAAMSPAAIAQAPAGGPPAGGPGAGGPPRGGAPRMAQVVVESKAFADGAVVPRKYSFYGSNTQPDFKLTNLPDGAQSVAIIFHDLDVAMSGTDDVLHWVAWNIPVTNGTATIEEGKLPTGSVQGRGVRGNGYMGMGAPAGPRYHHYVFEFYVLNSKLDLPESASRPELLEAMKGKVVGKAAYVGRFRDEGGAAPGAGGPGAGAPPRPAGQ